MPQLIASPTRIPVPGGKVIDEYVGVVNTPDTGLATSVSVAHMVAPADWSEPFQAPEFGEVTVVLTGSVLVDHDGGRLEVPAGRAVITLPGERVRYSCGPDGAEYVAVCLPAFSPDTVHRDEWLVEVPKVVLHDHLDGGLRPETIVDLAATLTDGGAPRPDLPTTDPEALGAWFRDSADSGSLTRYLETFDQTLAVMQTEEGLFRVASEAAQDLAADGVVYAESRYAPEQHLQRGLTLEQVVETVNAGFREGERLAAAAGRPVRVRALLTAMRHAANAREIAELAVRYRDEGVAGFDIAGAEAGFPPTRHLDAFEYLRRENAHFTIHAGEAFGLKSIWEAIQWCGADRLGHGVRIVDDVTVEGLPFPQWLEVAASGGLTTLADVDLASVRLGRLAAYVRDTRIPLEMCPSSNLQTGAARSVALHPISLLARLRFRVTLNTDNRLMSGTSMSREAGLLVAEADWRLEDLRWVTINAMKSAFLPFDERLALIEETIKPGYAVRSR